MSQLKSDISWLDKKSSWLHDFKNIIIDLKAIIVEIETDQFGTKRAVLIQLLNELASQLLVGKKIINDFPQQISPAFSIEHQPLNKIKSSDKKMVLGELVNSLWGVRSGEPLLRVKPIQDKIIVLQCSMQELIVQVYNSGYDFKKIKTEIDNFSNECYQMGKLAKKILPENIEIT